ncbi:MAG TPA: type VI secretion system tube protein Hcp [Fimbriimonas sp.]|nr:type VI secretion system tube protein Hcp [Fimbriimonas sp.]
MPIYMLIQGVAGNSASNLYPNGFDILSFSWGESFIFSAGGGGSGRADFSSLSVMLSAGKGTAYLMLKGATGGIIDEIIMVDTQMAASKEVIFERWTMDNVVISSYQISGDGGAKPVVSLSLTFDKLKFEQFVPRADGSHGDPDTVSVTNPNGP